MTRFVSPVALCSLILLMLSGCARYHYGVHEDDWGRMSQQERNEVIRIYHERRLQQDRRRAAEAEMRAHALAERRHHYPEYVHIRLSGGVFIYHGHRYQYHAHNLHLHQGEVKTIVLVSMDTRTPQRITLRVRYHDGKVMFGDNKRYLHSFDYDDSWKSEKRYTGVKLRGGLQMEGVELIIGEKPRYIQKHKVKQLPQIKHELNKKRELEKRLEREERARQAEEKKRLEQRKQKEKISAESNKEKVKAVKESGDKKAEEQQKSSKDNHKEKCDNGNGKGKGKSNKECEE